jgi:hypothetical protein
MKKEELAFLLDVKAIMEHAIFHQKSGTRLDIRMAVNHAHQAVELTLRKKAEHLDLTLRNFPDVISALKKEGVRVPYGRQIEELNKARILIQHYGTTPDYDDARRLVFVAKDFLIDFWKESFGADYDDISLTDLISSEDVRSILKEAERIRNPEERVIKSVLAIYMVGWWIDAAFYEKGPFAHPVDVVDTEVSAALDYVLDIALSGPFAYKLWKLRKHTGIVFLPIPGGKPILQKVKQVRFTRRDAEQVLELAIEYALWAEQVYS